MAPTTIRNETPARLTLIGAGGNELTLAPLEERHVLDASAFDLTKPELAGQVVHRHEVPSEVGGRIVCSIAMTGSVLALLCAMILAQEWEPAGLGRAGWLLTVWGSGAAILGLATLRFVFGETKFGTIFPISAAQCISLTAVLLIGFGLPAATIVFFGVGAERPAAAAAASSAGVAWATSPQAFGRWVQLSFISMASLLPVLLFFLFDRYQMSTLRHRVYTSVFRLRPDMRTRREIDARYGAQIDEAYGPADHGRMRLAAGSRSPVLVCALVTTAGWIVALAPVGAGYAPASALDALATFAPQKTMLAFGFLGVYVYSLLSLSVRYARRDLNPKAYTHMAVRFILVGILSSVIDAATPVGELGERVRLLVAFLIGITPEGFFVWAKDRLQSVPGYAAILPKLEMPTSDLEGIDLYERARLESDGIVNVHGLLQRDIVELIIETRIPVPRLVDWVDQAILFLYLNGGVDDGAARTKLRKYGIRTATDLEAVWKHAEREGSLDNLKALIGGTDTTPTLHRLEAIRAALSDDEGFKLLQSWRENTVRTDICIDVAPAASTTSQGKVTTRQAA